MHSAGSATSLSAQSPAILHISIHASRMGCNITKVQTERGYIISIHASRMKCNSVYSNIQFYINVSIHAHVMCATFVFQFMRPAMGATARFRYYLAIYTTFSI